MTKKKQKIKIGPINYEIVRQKVLFAEDNITKLLGHHKATESKILINSEYRNPQLEFCSLIHEITHGIDCQYNENSLSESTIEHMAQGISQILLDNLDLFIAEIKKIKNE